MSRPQTYEQSKLEKAEKYIQSQVEFFEERIELLESCAANNSGASIKEYWREFGIPNRNDGYSESTILQLNKLISETEIPYSMAISSLIREPVSVEDQKKTGAFYTDYRLSQLIAENRQNEIKKDCSVVDFAAGTGILLLGIAEEYKRRYTEDFNNWIEKKVYAFDLSKNALRGATAAFLSMTSNIHTLKEMTSKWKMCDSLLDTDTEKNDYDIVVGNPPWGKIKITRHSFVLGEGEHRGYGADYNEFDYSKYEEKRDGLANYSRDIKQKYDLLGKAEPDLYMAFLQKAMALAKSDEGKISLLVPAGLIRSQGTKCIREYLLDNSESLEIDLLDNKGNFFSIDTRFKFVLVSINKCIGKRIEKIDFSIYTMNKDKIQKGDKIEFNVKELKRIRPDFTIPEVQTEKEKNIFFKVYNNGIAWGESNTKWKADISREVDMTNDKKKFEGVYRKDYIPVIEGRMVQQHRFGVKSYVSGSGRSAVWKPCAKGGKAQFYISRDKLNEAQMVRVNQVRAGYCDIAGQTNERAMLSAVIPKGVICGNKVPTVIFPNAENDSIIYLWIGITNSFVFDWMIRRIISTTVNYFLLFSIPMPNIEMDSEIALSIISNTKKLSNMGENYYSEDIMQKLRAEIDVLVAKAYNLDFDDMEVIMNDFPIMDRKQPSINGEVKSTITRDIVLSTAEKNWNIKKDKYRKRYKTGKMIFAKAYIPSEMTVLCKGGVE